MGTANNKWSLGFGTPVNLSISARSIYSGTMLISSSFISFAISASSSSSYYASVFSSVAFDSSFSPSS